VGGGAIVGPQGGTLSQCEWTLEAVIVVTRIGGGEGEPGVRIIVVWE